MARELHRRDPGRLIAVDVWGAHPPKRGKLGKLYRNVDAIAVTNYVGWYENPLEPRATIKRLIRKRTNEFVRTFRGKVTIISEFGAEANALNPRTRPGGYEYQSCFLREHIRAYRESPKLSGMLRLEPARLRGVAGVRRRFDQPQGARASRSCAASTRRACSTTTARPSRRSPSVKQQYGTLGFGLTP